MKLYDVLTAAAAECGPSPSRLSADMRRVVAVDNALSGLDVWDGDYASLVAAYEVADTHLSVTGLVLAMNEEEVIERCVDSAVRDCTDIVVLDSGSTDGTLEIARAASAKVAVASRSWTGSFAEQRNHAISLVDDGWLFFIDADEYICTADRGNLRPVLGLLDFLLPGQDFLVSPRLTDCGSRGVATNTRKIFRRSSPFRFMGAIHERPYFQDGSCPPWIELDFGMEHTGYQPEVVIAKNKAERSRTMIEACRTAEPRNPKWVHYETRDVLLPGVRSPDGAKAAYDHLHSSLPWYSRPGIRDYEADQLIDATLLLCDLALRFGGREEIALHAAALSGLGRPVEAAYYTAVVEFGSAMTVLNRIPSRLQEVVGSATPDTATALGKLRELQALVSLSSGDYAAGVAYYEQARSFGCGDSVRDSMDRARTAFTAL
ncbi:MULTISPECIES: glycosyltransferase [unclassified Streptomyces]|uniref:glycosyltransferase n=1 Tax=unclassified Streptomyces TaxID=2593676 RepID=UPI00081D609F|nr:MULTISPECIES: glycosyltransferase [unclassified Streptomyces]MYR95908.1 glycosyltransferase [Streptomyces sp. SID4937]SCD99540.1 Glycosyl transferase family 2 [Streptomyces sp. ScaeMP-e83]